MKNNLKNALDTALRDMDWHGEEEVLRAVRAKRKPGIRLGRVPTRTLVLAVILITLIIGTALALGITFSIRYQIQRQAAEAVKSTYDLTDEMLDLFTYKRENTEKGWIASFEANAIHQKELGFYTVEKEADGTLSVTWSHDNADQELVASGELTSPAWGAKQLARIIPFYRQHMDRWKNVQNMDDLTLEEKAELDAPLLEVQEIGLLINIMPEKDDIPVETAKEIARNAITEKYGVSEEVLAKKNISVSFYLYGGTDRREYWISMDDPDLNDSYVVYVSSPDGHATRCRWMVSEENRTLYSSTTVGGNPNSGQDVSEQGLMEVNEALKEDYTHNGVKYFFLDSLSGNQGGRIVLKVALDGETQGNDYQDRIADLRMNFAVQIAGSPNAPKTGDDTNLLPYYIGMLISGLLLLYFALDSVTDRMYRKGREKA